jgi:L-lactate dehydrogenase complex protein LldF
MAAASLFRQRAAAALADPTLQAALARAQDGFVAKRARALGALPELERMREEACTLKDHVLANLDRYLESYEAQVVRRGGQVHWAPTREDACRIVIEICQRAGARLIAKGKSMVSEEIGLNAALEGAGLEVIETDLGEYIVQLAKERPSHIIAPAVHKTREQIAELFQRHHGYRERLTGVAELVADARMVLRERFLSADVGITGANFLVAETGSNVIVTNEGNGDLTCTLPRVHIVTAGIEKVVPTLEDATALIRLLGRSATGQEMTSYTTFSSGPRRADDRDGPQEYHVVLVDNGRSEMLGNRFRPMLRCIRCGACLNHCPIYAAVGGHAYGAIYPGPMGSVLTPILFPGGTDADLPNVCTFNGRCQQVCPVKIPLPDLLREHREIQYQRGITPPRQRWALALWGALVRHPRLYQILTRWVVGALGLAGRRQGSFRYLPFLGNWTAGRDFPAPQGPTFQAIWRKQERTRRNG